MIIICIVFEWDECKLVESQVKFVRENPDSEEDMNLTDAELRDYYMNNPEFFSETWDCMLDALTDIMEYKQRRYKCKDWFIEGQHMGWMNRSGLKISSAVSGEGLLSDILPKTDCSFTIFDTKMNELRITVYHHDAPTGELYICSLMSQKDWKQFEKDGGIEGYLERL